jgi:poly(3-hydroxybutyrate) depolymerase
VGIGGSSSGNPSSGCSETNVATGADIDATMTVGGLERVYRLSVPTDYVPGEPLPLVFVLNGVGGDGPSAQQMFAVETNHRGIFVYPTSLPNDEAGGAIAWDFSLNGVDVPFFDAMVSELTASYCVDLDRIFALGASSGGIMANKLGCFRGDVFRAIAPASAMTWSEPCQGEVAVMVICGAQDTYNPCETDGQGQVDFWTGENGCTSQSSQSSVSDLCQEYQGCAAGNPVLFCTHSGGHMWPSSMNDDIWSFFMGL